MTRWCSVWLYLGKMETETVKVCRRAFLESVHISLNSYLVMKPTQRRKHEEEWFLCIICSLTEYRRSFGVRVCVWVCDVWFCSLEWMFTICHWSVFTSAKVWKYVSAFYFLADVEDWAVQTQWSHCQTFYIPRSESFIFFLSVTPCDPSGLGGQQGIGQI